MFQNVIRLEKTSNSESVSLPVWRLEIFCWGDMKKNLIKGRSLESVWSLLKRRKENKLGERREKWGAMHRLVVCFWDCFTATFGGFMLLYYMEGRGRGSGGPSPEKFLVEYVQNCDILDQLGRKTLPTGQFLFLTFGYWNGIEIITNYFEN